MTKILQYENSKIGTCDAFCVLILKTRNTIYVSNYLSTYLRYLITFHSHIPVTNLHSTTLDYRETDASRGNKYLKNIYLTKADRQQHSTLTIQKSLSTNTYEETKTSVHPPLQRDFIRVSTAYEYSIRVRTSTLVVRVLVAVIFSEKTYCKGDCNVYGVYVYAFIYICTLRQMYLPGIWRTNHDF